MPTCYEFNLLEQDIGFDQDSKSINLVSGTDNIAQTAALILKTFYGENCFYTDFGTRLQSILGEPFQDEFTVASIFKEALKVDNRFKDIVVDWVDYEPESHVLTAKVTITLYNNETIELITEV